MLFLPTRTDSRRNNIAVGILALYVLVSFYLELFHSLIVSLSVYIFNMLIENNFIGLSYYFLGD